MAYAGSLLCQAFLLDATIGAGGQGVAPTGSEGCLQARCIPASGGTLSSQIGVSQPIVIGRLPSEAWGCSAAALGNCKLGIFSTHSALSLTPFNTCKVNMDFH